MPVSATPSHLDAIAAAAPRGPSHVLVTHAHSDHVVGRAGDSRAMAGGASSSKHPWPIRDPDAAAGRGSPTERSSTTDEGDSDGAAHAGARARSPDALARRIAHAVCRRHAGAGQHRRDSRLAWRQPCRVPAVARAHAAAQPRARVAGARAGDRRSGGADSTTTSSIARSARRRCSARWQPATSTVESITAKIYPSLIDALVPMARESVLAHLHEARKRRPGRRATATAGSSRLGDGILRVTGQSGNQAAG